MVVPVCMTCDAYMHMCQSYLGIIMCIITMQMIANVLSDVSKLVKTIRPQWERLAESHPSLKEVVPSILDPSASPAFDAEGRIKAIEERLRRLQSLQEFLKNLDNVLEWFQRARDATIPKARATFSLLSLMEQLQELYVST